MIKVTVIGCGEVGLAYAEAMNSLARAPQFSLFDPSPPPAALQFAERTGVQIQRTLESWAGSSDLVLICTPGSVLDRVLDGLLPVLNAGTVIADMSTAGADAKRFAAARCAHRGLSYIDIAITGSVALGRARTPLLYAGPPSPELLALFGQFQAPVTVLEGAQPGDAIRVKLLRSVLMKGLEALAVECLPAAAEYGLLEQLLVSLGDVDRTGFVPLLKAMTRTHAQHAVRRSHEVAEAAAQLGTVDLPSAMTHATQLRFSATASMTANGSWPASDTTEAAIEWLRTAQRPSLV